MAVSSSMVETELLVVVVVVVGAPSLSLSVRNAHIVFVNIK
jgi:hypothetical protein